MDEEDDIGAYYIDDRTSVTHFMLSNEDGPQSPTLSQDSSEDEERMSPEHDDPMAKEVVQPDCSVQKKKAGLNESLDEDGQNCTICFEPWTNSSDHRLVSLRCGHLFGRSCITKWLKGQTSRCPQCNARARKSEIRNIYAKSIKVMDSTERDNALRDLQKESELRRQAEMCAAQERLKHCLAIQECERLKKDLIEAHKLLQEYRSGGRNNENSQAVKPKAAFLVEKIVEIAKKGGCKVVDVCELLGMILVSQPTTNDLFQGHGFRKISSFDMKPAEFILVHQKPIKDMSFHKNDGLVLTASLDKTVKITNVLTNSVVQTYSCPTDVWSCIWDLDDPTYFYAGLRTGEVLLFDIRVTSQHVQELPKFGINTPAVSLQYLPRSSNSTGSKCGPVVAKLSDCGFYQKLDQPGDFKVVSFPSLGPLCSLSIEPISGHFLLSRRPSTSEPRISHSVYEMNCDKETQNVVCNPIMTIMGGRMQVQLSRSKLLTHPENESSLLVCAGDEDSQGALVWDTSSGGVCVDHLRTESSVRDMIGIKINLKSHILSLTNKTLRLYRWNDE